MGASRLPSLALSIVLLALGPSGVAACGGSGGGQGGSPSTSASAGPGSAVFFARPQLLADAVVSGLEGRPSGPALQPEEYTSGETILADLAAGRHADVIEVCSDESARRLAEQGLLQPLDTTRLENWGRLYPALKELPGVALDGEVYMAPVTATVTGILYDPERVAPPPSSFRDLFAPRFAGRLGFRDDAALAFEVGALIVGLDPVALTPSQATEVEIYLKHHKEKYRSFWYDFDNLASAFKGGRVVAATGTRATAEQLRRRGVRVTFVAAAEGQPLQACGLAISAQAHDLDAAYALIDYYLDPRTQARLAISSGELVSNRDAAVSVPLPARERLGLLDLAGLDRPVPLLPSLEHLDWIQSWYEVKKGRG